MHHAAAVDPLVDLGYIKYHGTPLSNGITQWLGMRYARPMTRLDSLRFAAPQDPLPNSTTVEADQHGPVCIRTGVELKAEFGGQESEDCLFADVYAPSTATSANPVPVFVFIQGGGFNGNANANYNGSSLIQAGDMDIVVVNFNYRTGPYGFLASNEIATNKSFSLNNGLKDQRQLLKWVNKHINKFGGDPNHVVLGGASAGGASVVLQLTAYGGRNDHLIHGAAAESQAFPPLRDVKDSEFMYTALLSAAGCKDLQCLSSMDAVRFQNAVAGLSIPFTGAKDAPIYFWGPTLDGDFIKDFTYNELAAGHFLKVPAIFGDDTNEGIIFTPTNISSQADSDQFIQDQFPSLTQSDLDKLRSVFPGPSNYQHDIGWRKQAADVYGYIRYICPGLNISDAYAGSGNTGVWNYRWNVGNATHVAELFPVFFDGQTDAGKFIHQYWASFIRSFDPNKFMPSNAPNWGQWGGKNGFNRIRFDDNNVVVMENVPNQQKNQCALVNSLGVAMNQ
ncbi:alpha/beta-hydrolase [Lepidopterella palustris CBS 459.81]|uniref:Carboxylic ester hydrolase n=1 Tax=Lepidopterella palustris CBS 459.81 TaxID=1314670 RepID=A0A8E2JK81_9PEZI|nr:alpha/beta-hydrolase [Lepidopterella palustris CBS 459.81]